ncbi:MADS-box protein SVP isoform X5 [Prunus persica]|uniref:MADS-box protein SVP isoform X5 n=1 Tax=Prunus persica TaxID=3760 RepID=UPI0009AB4DE3|nr:MADS-box protein SVP isoform X5 [Prunus persica]
MNLQMKAEDLEELNFDELQKLEQLVDASLGRVIETKEELRMSEIMALERKGAELVEANNQLRQTMMLSGGNTGPTLMEPERLSNNIGGGGEEEGMSSESAISTTCNSALSLSPSLGDDSDDVTLSLKLGEMVKMMREKIKIKKIDYLPARQVTFSKRRRGIFKKAAELSVLCESEVAVVIFSATGKLFDYSSSSIKDVIERYEVRTNGVEKSDEQSLELQLENENHTKLSTELEEKNRQLRQMKGEDLEELDLDELLKLEQLVEATLVRVMETKEELIMSDIVALEKKGTELVEANNQMVMLRERMVMLSKRNTGPALMEPSESATSTSCNSALSLSLEDDCSDDVVLSLKLGLTVRAGRRPMCLKT